MQVAGWNVRIVETHERVDVCAPTVSRLDVRFRVTLLPGESDQFGVNIKGLNCFVAKPGGAPTPAIVATTDGSAVFVSMQKERLGWLSFSFGALGPGARVFVVEGGQVVVPFPVGVFALALQLEQSRELIVVCRRA
jgi:hypothetical protein